MRVKSVAGFKCFTVVLQYATGMDENIGQHHVLFRFVPYEINIWHVESPKHGSRVENRKMKKRINK